MKFMLEKMGQTGLLISLCVVVSACNPSEYFPTQEFVEGIDAYCAEAKDELSCSHLVGCQAAYEDTSDATDPSAEIPFSACVANPDFLPPSDGSTTGGSTAGGSTAGGSTSGVDDGSTTGSTTGGASTGSTDGGYSTGTTAGGSTTGGTDGSTTGGTSGSTTGGTNGNANGNANGGANGNANGGANGNANGGANGNANGGSTGGVISTPGSIGEAWQSKCANLDDKYMYVKKLVNKKSTKFVSKVKVCHLTGNGSSHTIIIACPALKAHVDHHDDYLGSCQQ